MPDLELKPDDYRVQTKRGNWLSRDDFRLMLPYVGGVAIAFVGFAWWNRAELPLIAMLATVAVASFVFGAAIGIWLKRFD